MAAHFKISRTAKKFFKDIMGSGSPEKLMQFDVYYCCALVGMIAGKAADIEEDEKLEDMLEGYPLSYNKYKADLAGALVSAEIKRLGFDPSEDDIRETMLKFLSNSDTLLTDEGVKRMNLYSARGFRLLQENQFINNKPQSIETFLTGVYREIEKYN